MKRRVGGEKVCSFLPHCMVSGGIEDCRIARSWALSISGRSARPLET